MSIQALNFTATRLDLKRTLRDRATVFFGILFPVLLYLIFGTTNDVFNQPVLHGTVGGVFLVSMALYGGLFTSAVMNTQAARTYATGWGRHIALTPMSSTAFIVNKILTVGLFTAVPIAAVMATGFFQGAKIDGFRWLWASLIVWLCTMLFSVVGFLIGFSVQGRSAESITSGFVVLCCFAGNLFTALDGTMLEISKFTPFFGINGLARIPVMGSDIFAQTDTMENGLWVYVANSVIWLAILALGAIFVGRKRIVQR